MTESEKACLGKQPERVGKLQTQHGGAATISANCAHRPSSGRGRFSQWGLLKQASILPTNSGATENPALGAFMQRMP